MLGSRLPPLNTAGTPLERAGTIIGKTIQINAARADFHHGLLILLCYKIGYISCKNE